MSLFYRHNKVQMNTDIGKKIYNLASEIFPINRSLSGDGVRQTIHIINKYIHNSNKNINQEKQFTINEIPSGSTVFDWTVPKEWMLKEAFIENSEGSHIIDFKENNLHVLGYSAPIDKWVTLEELKKYIYTQPEQPDVIPYVTSYYKERSGFCMSAHQLQSLPDGRYRGRGNYSRSAAHRSPVHRLSTPGTPAT